MTDGDVSCIHTILVSDERRAFSRLFGTAYLKLVNKTRMPNEMIYLCGLLRDPSLHLVGKDGM